MNRPWRVWLVFLLCAGLVLAAMGWISHTVLQLERTQLAADRRADLEERVRLALWRMDSALTALLIEESARPPTDYESPAPEGSGAKGAQNRLPQRQLAAGPDPSAAPRSTTVRLHFQLSLDGQLSSPQRNDDTALHLAGLRWILDQTAPSDQGTASLGNGELLIRESAAPEIRGPMPAVQVAMAPVPSRNAEVAQQFRNTVEFNQRANVSQQVQQTVAGNLMANDPGRSVASGLDAAAAVFRPVWLGDSLVLARRVQSRGSAAVQGAWLDWDALRASLLASIEDLFDAADLQPVRLSEPKRRERMLATLPVKLVPNESLHEPAAGWTPLRVALGVAWGCVLVAALSVALLLQGALSLSERRGAFVSAVTHEMRTPLTTFKMYSEMLADGMVTDDNARKQYLSTLCLEANRLSHLVENVLAYARLERGSARSRAERISIGDLLDRVGPRLAERAAQVGLQLVTEAETHVRTVVVHVDPAAVEQILFNLVDNACKYAAPASSQPRVQLRAVANQRGFTELHVRDHGPGVAPAMVRRLFQPFSKSAGEAAGSAPGIGLGLALCRRLSRSMRGDLRLDTTVKDGACFVLTLPDGASGRATIA